MAIQVHDVWPNKSVPIGLGNPINFTNTPASVYATLYHNISGLLQKGEDEC